MQNIKGLDQVDVSVAIQVELFTRDWMRRALTLHGREPDFVAEKICTAADLNGD